MDPAQLVLFSSLCGGGCQHLSSHLFILLFVDPGVDLEAAKRLEEEQIMTDARTWLKDGPPANVQHPKTGATPLHVAAAKGYLEALKSVLC